MDSVGILIYVFIYIGSYIAMYLYLVFHYHLQVASWRNLE